MMSRLAKCIPSFDIRSTTTGVRLWIQNAGKDFTLLIVTVLTGWNKWRWKHSWNEMKGDSASYPQLHGKWILAIGQWRHCSWEGNRRSGVAPAVHHRLWYIHHTAVGIRHPFTYLLGVHHSPINSILAMAWNSRSFCGLLVLGFWEWLDRWQCKHMP